MLDVIRSPMSTGGHLDGIGMVTFSSEPWFEPEHTQT